MENTQAQAPQDQTIRKFTNEQDEEAKAYFIKEYATDRAQKVCMALAQVDMESVYRFDVYEYVMEADLTERERLHVIGMYIQARDFATQKTKDPMEMLAALMKSRG